MPIGDQDVSCVDCHDRLDGVLSAMPDAEIRVISAGHNAEASGERAARWFLDHPDRPTAIVAMSDVLAIGVLRVLTAAGIDVPADISLASFDDIPAAEWHGLTTVRQPITEKGREIGRLLLDPDRPDRQIILDCELVVRSTTGPAPA